MIHKFYKKITSRFISINLINFDINIFASTLFKYASLSDLCRL